MKVLRLSFLMLALVSSTADQSSDESAFVQLSLRKEAMRKNRHVHAVNPMGSTIPKFDPTFDPVVLDEDWRSGHTLKSFFILLTSAFAIFLGMLFFCNLLQACYRRLLRDQQDLVRTQGAVREQLTDKIKELNPRRTEPGKHFKRSKVEDKPYHDEREFVTFVNGDHVRLELLLEMASSQDPKAAVKELVEKIANRSKLELSDRSLNEASEGLQEMVDIAVKVNQKRDPTREPKRKLQEAVHDVLMQVRRKSDEDKLMLPQISGADRPQHLPKKHRAYLDFSERHTDALHTSNHTDGPKDALRMYQGTPYLSSHRWLEHAAILFIASYGQVCAMVYAFNLRWNDHRMFDWAGSWLLLSRGEAMAIIIHSSLMILFMCRRFVTFLRRYVSYCSVLETMVDKHVLMHRTCAAMIVISALLHICGHLRGTFPAIISQKKNPDGYFPVALHYSLEIFNFRSWNEAVISKPAVTGYLLISLLCLFWATAYARRYSFELFHYSHLCLIVLWPIALTLHGEKQWLGIGQPMGLFPVGLIVAYWALERVCDIDAGKSPTIKIACAVIKRRMVLLEIDTGSSGFSYQTGMYCMLKVPTISNFQWHPFTIASAGNQNSFQVLFAISGDWTQQLRDVLQESQRSKTEYPGICIRGGYGAPAQSMKGKKHLVMVGGGVGATPFLAFLSDVCSAPKAGAESSFDDLCTAVFYWVSREPEDFTWVTRYLSVIEATPWLKERVSVHLCLSQTLETAAGEGRSSAEVALFWHGVQAAMRRVDKAELRKELAVPTQFGRPHWKKELEACAAEALEHRKRSSKKVVKARPLEISVFACGSQTLTDSLEEACDSLTNESTTFNLFVEQFLK